MISKRKGAIAAHAGEKVLIPINMRDESVLAIGKGNPEWNFSAPHGAGRIMSRTKAKSTLSLYGEEARPRGSSDEGFVHTNWGRVTPGPGLWHDAYETTEWLVAWPCAFRLEVMRNLAP